MKKVILALVVYLMASASYAAEVKKYTRNVAIVLYENVQPLDWVGPYEVYHDAASFGTSNGQPAFNVYTVSKTAGPVNGQGMKIVPDYTIANAPKPDIVIFPGGPSANVHGDPEFFAWASEAAKGAEVAQSVCTGAFVLGKAGLLDGLDVTTFYGAIEGLRTSYPKARVHDGRRFIDSGKIVTTAGISAGIDGSLNVVARLLGRRVAEQVAQYMEYRWTPESYLVKNYAYLNPSTDDRGRLMQTADMHYDEKRYKEAETIYRAMIKESPDLGGPWESLGVVLRVANDHAGAAKAFVAAAERGHGGHAAHLFVIAAKQYALASMRDGAVRTLQRAFEAGYSDRDAIKTDPAFAAIKDDPRLTATVVRK